jgi:hypothetical protein
MKPYADKSESTAIAQAREGVEQKLGGHVAEVRRNLQHVLNEALALRNQ